MRLRFFPFFRSLLRRVYYFFKWDPWCELSWSQEGEDQILRRIFEGKSSGVYVDVGAHHPKRFSNTYYFYRQGWSGINIDAMPGAMVPFSKLRPRDINLECGVGLADCELDYYIFNEPALNGFSRDLSEVRERDSDKYRVVDVVKVRVRSLSSVLEEYFSEGDAIDFMSVDVEGLDFEVLASNDWQKFRPQYVLAEVLGSSLQDISSSEIALFMQGKGYEVYAKCVNTVFFKDVDN